MLRGNPSVFRPKDGASCPPPKLSLFGTGSSGNAASVDVADFAFLLSHSLSEYAFKYLIFLRLDGISLGIRVNQGDLQNF